MQCIFTQWKVENKMDDLDATNLNFQMPQYMLPPDLAMKVEVSEFRKFENLKVVDRFRSFCAKKNISKENLTSFLGGQDDHRIVTAVKGALTQTLMAEKLSVYDETECLNPANEKNLILQVVSYY